ncbi:hypothetical protein BDQ17DRAFT_1341399 [Cyathus striatus]|nr:hypothetical protein BDQ17DRAFT_1341399 [Cyathus striatus]
MSGTSFLTQASGTSYYRPTHYTAPIARPRPDVRDDYERWYTETVPNNRMSLSLRSGVHSEVAWALDRVCRLCLNEQFIFSTYPGLIDGLFDWPEWYVTEGYKYTSDIHALFSPPPEQALQRRFALESLFILRNASLHEQNIADLARHSHTGPLLLNALHKLDPKQDENNEFLLHVIEIVHALAEIFVISHNAHAETSPVPPLVRVVSESSNRTMIITSLSALTAVLSYPVNAAHLLILHEQQILEENVSIDITGLVHVAQSTTVSQRDHELSKDELDGLLEKAEPHRCFDWMKIMFVPKTDGELTQVDFWNLYKDAFSPYQDKYPLLVASDVIKNVSLVFPQAQAMVLQGPVQKFVVRGVDRRKEIAPIERFKCLWDRSQCHSSAFSSPGELYDHLLEHLSASELAEFPCLWSACRQTSSPKAELRIHSRDPSQSDTITLPSADSQYPIEDPTKRPVPPARQVSVDYKRAALDPPSTSLTALLIVRILFRTSFASAEAAPRVDGDHFGFPGVVEEAEEGDGEAAGDIQDGSEDEWEGEKRGRKAFVGVRRLLEGVRIRDEVLMSWVTEMVDAGIGGMSE